MAEPNVQARLVGYSLFRFPLTVNEVNMDEIRPSLMLHLDSEILIDASIV